MLAAAPMALSIISLVAGFVLLWRGGDLLVEGADRFARSHGVPGTIAGVFILGFGTSVPELSVSVIAALQGSAGIAAGNVIGSNICNVALVLAVSAVILPVAASRFLVRIEMPVCLIASFLTLLLVADGSVTRTDGLVLLAAFLLYTGYAIGTVKRRDADVEENPPPKRAWFDLGKATIALAAVVGGATLFSDGARDIARELGVSETVIGLTLVALGTSLPELATSIAAARIGKSDLALGNVVGSNIFNLLMVLGTSATLVAQDVEDRMVRIDVPLMVLLMLVVFVLSLTRRRVGRLAGLALLLIYVAYVAVFSRPEIAGALLERLP